MRTFHTSPLRRSTVGFDRIFDMAYDPHAAGDDRYPPCNVERLSNDRYRISMALAGFSAGEIAITAEQNLLTIEGRKTEEAQRDFLYRGISSRPFTRRFNLADHVRVETASFVNGLLEVLLIREKPQAVKPRRIPIDDRSLVQQFESRAA